MCLSALSVKSLFVWQNRFFYYWLHQNRKLLTSDWQSRLKEQAVILKVESLNVDKDTQPNTHTITGSALKRWLFSCCMLTRQAHQMQRCLTSWTGLYLPSQTANVTDQSIRNWREPVHQNHHYTSMTAPLHKNSSSSFIDVGRMRQTSHHDFLFIFLLPIETGIRSADLAFPFHLYTLIKGAGSANLSLSQFYRL